jgi:hypothetical protein
VIWGAGGGRRLGMADPVAFRWEWLAGWPCGCRDERRRIAGQAAAPPGLLLLLAYG